MSPSQAVEDRPGPLAGRALAVVAALAAGPRLLGLGSGSMWLDEILQTWQARGGVSALLAAQRGDDHPPLDALLSLPLVHAGASESARRLLPVVWGVLAVVVLARWASERFGPRVGAAVGLLAAFSPIHVRYSQELRPYSLALLLFVVVLWRADALWRSPGRRQALALALALVACAYTLYLAVVVLVPLALLLFEARRGRPPELAHGAERAVRRAPAFLGLVALAVAPVAFRALTMPGRAMQAGAATWDLAAIARRWQDLTVGGIEGEPFGWGGALAAMLALAGVTLAARSPAGRAALAGVVVGTLGVELLLALAGHWSNARYDLMAWPFLVVLLALGLARLDGDEGSPSTHLRRGRRVAVALLLAALLAADLRGIATSLRGGRPDWRRVAGAVTAAAQPDDVLLAGNEWTRVSLLHYFEEAGRADLGRRLQSLDGDPARLDAALAAPAGSALPGAATCALLVVGGYPASASLDARLAASPVWLEVAQTARVHRLVGAGGAAKGDSCERSVPLAIRREPLLRERLLPFLPAVTSEDLRIDFAESSTPHLTRGFSGAERTPDGATFRWVVGREAEVALALSRTRDLRLALALWPFAASGLVQRVSVEVNGQPAGTRDLAAGWQRLELEVPAAFWRRGENRIGLRFDWAVAPADLDAAAGDARPLAAALDELELGER